MVSDFVKGNQKLGYPVIIQKGIQLHREIDTFTDSHPATAKAKDFFRSHYRLYSGAIVDVIYDHFLANDNSLFTEQTLFTYTGFVYEVLEQNAVHLPRRFLPVLTYMRMENWLYNYRLHDGIQKSLRGLVRRAAYITDSTAAFDIFNNSYDELHACYKEFFPDVKQMAKQKLEEFLA